MYSYRLDALNLHYSPGATCWWELPSIPTGVAAVQNKNILDFRFGFFFSGKGKSYLITLLAFYSGGIALVNKGRAADVIHLDLIESFDTVL